MHSAAFFELPPNPITKPGVLGGERPSRTRANTDTRKHRHVRTQTHASTDTREHRHTRAQTHASTNTNARERDHRAATRCTSTTAPMTCETFPLVAAGAASAKERRCRPSAGQSAASVRGAAARAALSAARGCLRANCAAKLRIPGRARGCVDVPPSIRSSPP